MTSCKIKYLTSEETKKLFDEIEKDTSRHAKRNKALFLVMKYCALRISEVGLLQVNEYNREKNELMCHRLKNSHDNLIRICDKDVIEALKVYLNEKEKIYPDSSMLFPSQFGSPISRQTLDNLFKRYCKNVSIPKCKQHCHVLKHTRAIELGELGLDIKDIQWWLGHKCISNTLIYMQFTTRQQDLLYQKYLLAMQVSQREEKHE